MVFKGSSSSCIKVTDSSGTGKTNTDFSFQGVGTVFLMSRQVTSYWRGDTLTRLQHISQEQLQRHSQKVIQLVPKKKKKKSTLELIVQSLFHGETRLPRVKCASSAAVSHVSHTDKLINSVFLLPLRLNLPSQCFTKAAVSRIHIHTANICMCVCVCEKAVSSGEHKNTQNISENGLS